MIFLNIHIAIGILFLILFTLSSIDIAYEFKRLYPDIKNPKSNWAGSVLSILKSIIKAFIPLFNLALCWVILFNYDEIKTKTIDKVYADCIAKEKNS